jgi:hypothetical protein
VIRVHPLRALLALAYMASIFALSALPGRALAGLGLWAGLADLLHVPLYAGLALVTILALEGRLWLRVAITAATCLLFALTDEWHQTFVPGRVFAAADLRADAVGVALGISLREGWRIVGAHPQHRKRGDRHA